MPAAWRLATSSLSARLSRSLLLVAAVTLSASLIAAVACAIASASGAIEEQLESQIGRADLRVGPTGRGGSFTREVYEQISAWPEVERAVPRAREPISVRWTGRALKPDPDGGPGFRLEPADFIATGFGNGVAPEIEFSARPVTLITGRLPEAPGEVVIDALFAERLSFSYNDRRAAAGAYNKPGTETEYLALPPPEWKSFVGAGDAESLQELRGWQETVAASLTPGQAGGLNAAVGVRPGDTIELIRRPELGVEYERLERQFGFRTGTISRWMRLVQPVTRLTVVGIAEPPPLGGLPQASMSLETLAAAGVGGGRLNHVEIDLRDGYDARVVLERREAEMPEGVVLQLTEKVTSQLDKNLASNRIGFMLASVLAFLSAAFIIMTGLNTGVAEQQRALAILRCVGATKGQMAASQLYTGLIIGGAGALLGTPLGVFFAWVTITYYSGFIPTGLVVPPGMLAVSVAGSVLAGLLGAAWPAWRVARLSPLRGLSGRAEPLRPVHLTRVIVIGLLGLVIQAAIVGFAPNNDWLFWGYATTGLPAMFIGYFLLSVPVTLLVVKLLGEPLSKLLGLPPRVLSRTVAATPFRHGLTAGAMMSGLALLISIWTNGGSVLRDWLDRIEFPSAFVNGLRLPPEAKERLEAIPFVRATCAITMHPVDTDAFEVSGLSDYSTTFIAFEPSEFFNMVSLEFFENGKPAKEQETARAYALERLERGGSVIIGREFYQSKGVGVGDVITLRDRGTPHEFEVVGVVTSPGLELASKFFNIGEEYVDQSIHAVFGARQDMVEKFGTDNIQLIQILWDYDQVVAMAAKAGVPPSAAPDQWAVREIRDALLGLGVLDADSGQRMKQEITGFITGSLVVFSAVAVVSMLVACCGVANLIMAAIESRRFEFGVLRAVGAARGQVVRLVLGEAVIIGVTAGVVGTLMGIQGSWAGTEIYGVLGLDLRLAIPATPVLIGWGVVLFFTVGAAAPAILRLNARPTRELLAAAPA